MSNTKDSVLTPRARELRQNMTPQERKLWYGFLQEHPFNFRRQHVIEQFIVDFYCAKAQLVIELDGHQHQLGNSPAYDSERDSILRGHGLTVLRFSNEQIESDFDLVCHTIDRYIG